MKTAFLLFALSAQTLYAGLEKYSQFVVADSKSARPAVAPYHAMRVTYLGANGFEFRSANHALLVDPYFSRIRVSRIAIGGRIQPNLGRIDDAMKRLSPGIDAILVTHAHFDHMLDVPPIIQKTRARLFGSAAAIDLARRAGVPGGDVVRVGDLVRVGPWKIRVLPATHDRLFGKVPFNEMAHASGPPRRAGDWICGQPLAFLIEAEGQSIYIDSGGTPALLPVGNHVDLAILGAALPDSRRRFAAAINTLHARFVFPSHQDNFFKPLSAGFQFGPLTNFQRLIREHEHGKFSGQLILLDYFRPWTLPKK